MPIAQIEPDATLDLVRRPVVRISAIFLTVPFLPRGGREEQLLRAAAAADARELRRDAAIGGGDLGGEHGVGPELRGAIRHPGRGS